MNEEITRMQLKVEKTKKDIRAINIKLNETNIQLNKYIEINNRDRKDMWEMISQLCKKLDININQENQ